MKNSDRHPALEALVFGLALLLACVLGYYALTRSKNKTAADSPADRLPSSGESVNPRPTGGLIMSGTERGVGSLPAVKGSPKGPARKRRAARPVP